MSSMTRTMDQQAEYREIFASFDEEGQGRLPLNQVGPAVRATGRNPTEAEIASMIAPFQEKGVKDMSYDEFVGIIPSEEPEWHAVRASLTETLRAFDKEDTGMLPLRELRYILGELGDKMTEKEVDDLVRGLEVNRDGFIRCEDFIHKITSV
ncbi:MAG: hypothetical protein DHS80DRAFT_24133 [Piptocephalis tieghemiana]|nr:MAG: hypothetical protein DHS80DRAFT_24133 [Piptocephalis tieghemiana]